MDESKKRRTKEIPWLEIQQDACLPPGLDYDQLSEKYGVQKNTIVQYARRKKWAMAYRIVPTIQRRALQVGAERAVKQIAEEWSNKGEKHRKVVFDLAHDSLKLMKAHAPKSFREAEAADKMARRAAGLETAEINQQTLININESIDSFDEPTPVEATVVP